MKKTLLFLTSFFILLGAVFCSTHVCAQASSSVQYVTASQYANFLNQAALSDPNHLFDEKMESDPQSACIARTGAPGRWHYEVITGRENVPIKYVSSFNEEKYCAEAGDVISAEDKNEDPYLRSNIRGFAVNVFSSPTLTLATAASTSTSNFNSYIEVAGLVGLIAFSSAFVTLGDFREAATRPDNAGAERLIVRGEGANSIIVAANDGNRDENIIIIDHLRTALQAEHTSENASTFIATEIGQLARIGETSSRLSTARLQRILAAADRERDPRVAAGESLQEPETTLESLRKWGTTIVNKKKTAREVARDAVEGGVQTVLNFFHIKNDALPAQAANLLVSKNFEERLDQFKQEQEKREVVESLVYTMIDRSRTFNSFNTHYKAANDRWIEADNARNQRPFTRWNSEAKAELQQKAVELLEELKTKLENKDIDNTPLGKAAWLVGILTRPISWINVGIDGSAVAEDLKSVLEFANTTIEKYPTASASFAVHAAMKDFEKAAEEAQRIEERAPALLAAAQQAEKDAIKDDGEFTMALAKSAKPPLDTSEEESWKKWATDFMESSRIFELAEDVVKERLIAALSSQGRAMPDWVDNIITTAWRQRKNDSIQYAERLTQPDSPEAKALRDLNEKYQAAHHEAMLLRTALEKKNNAEARLYQAKGELTDLENQERLIPQTASAADDLEARRRIKNKSRAKLEEVSQREVALQQAETDWKSLSQKLTLESAEEKISKILNRHYDQEENFKRNIARAEARAAADHEAWKATWPELYFKEEADIAWSEAERASEIAEAAWRELMALCAKAGSDWPDDVEKFYTKKTTWRKDRALGAESYQEAEAAWTAAIAAKRALTEDGIFLTDQVDAITKTFIEAERFALVQWERAIDAKKFALTKISGMDQHLKVALTTDIDAKASKYLWYGRVARAENNALDLKKPGVLEAKAAFARAKTIWIAFSREAQAFIEQPNAVTLEAIERAASTAMHKYDLVYGARFGAHPRSTSSLQFLFNWAEKYDDVYEASYDNRAICGDPIFIDPTWKTYYWIAYKASKIACNGRFAFFKDDTASTALSVSNNADWLAAWADREAARVIDTIWAAEANWAVTVAREVACFTRAVADWRKATEEAAKPSWWSRLFKK